MPIYIATKRVQMRKHHKKRINKKWQKRYRYIEFNMMPHGAVFFDEINRVIHMTQKTYDELKVKL